MITEHELEKWTILFNGIGVLANAIANIFLVNRYQKVRRALMYFANAKRWDKF